MSSSGDQRGSSSDFGNIVPTTLLASSGGCSAFSAAAGTAQVAGSAGVVSVTGGNDTLTFTPNGTSPNVVYTTTYGGTMTPEFNSGAVLSFSAPGGPDIGSFSGMVTAPAPIAGYTPPTSISRSAGVALTWTAATSSTMELDIIAKYPTDGAAQPLELVVCRFADTGSFTVPSSVLSALGSGYTSALQFYLQRINETSLSVGSWTVDLDAVQGDERATNLTIGP